jgi:hypothetical protein
VWWLAAVWGAALLLLCKTTMHTPSVPWQTRFSPVVFHFPSSFFEGLKEKEEGKKKSGREMSIPYTRRVTLIEDTGENLHHRPHYFTKSTRAH